MKKILLGSVATGALGAARPASAAALGQRPAYKAPPVAAPVPVFSWTGCFGGAHGGWGWSRKDVRVSSNSHSGPGNGTATGGLDSSGAIFGGQIGCDYQFGFGKGPGSAGAWVIVIQGDFAGARLTGDIPTPLHAGPTATAHTFLRTDWLSSVTGRVGITGWLPRTLLYTPRGAARC